MPLWVEVAKVGLPFRFPLKLSEQEIAVALDDLLRYCPKLQREEACECARCLLIFLRENYLWLRAASDGRAPEGFWEACCKVRFNLVPDHALSPSQQEAAH